VTAIRRPAHSNRPSRSAASCAKKQGINYPDGTLELEAVTARDLEHLDFGIAQGSTGSRSRSCARRKTFWRVKSHLSGGRRFRFR